MKYTSVIVWIYVHLIPGRRLQVLVNFNVVMLFLKLMRSAEKIFGHRITGSVIRTTFYKQFVGGETESELVATTQMLSKSNLRLMVCPGNPTCIASL